MTVKIVKTKIYLATPIESAARSKEEYLDYAEKVAKLLEENGCAVYRPWKMHIPNAWDLSNEDWGNAVAENDIEEIKKADAVVCICYDRNESTPGVSWELGYSYGLDKPTLIIEHESVKVMSLLFSYASTRQVKGLQGLQDLLDGKYIKKYRETEVK